MDRYTPRTQFVLDRLRETSWENRGRIVALITLERFAERGGAKSYAEGIAFQGLVKKFPVQWRCILKEVQDGQLTTGAEFQRLLDEHVAEEEAKRKEWERAARRRQTKELQLEEQRRRRWLEMGGLA